MRTDTKYIREIKKAAGNPEFQVKHILDNKTNFSRNRKMSFSDMIMYIIGNTRSPICLEAERFSKHLSKDITGAAICKARKKIKYTAFQELFEMGAGIVPRTKTFHEYNIIAVDGMKGELPKTPELTAKYSISEKNRVPIFHAVSAYDVLNEIFIESEMHFGAADERSLACDIIDRIKQNEAYRNEKQIWVFDRGFPSLILLQKLMEYNMKFVIRVPKIFLTEVNEFRESKYIDKTVHINYTKERMKSNHVKSNGICEFDLRCVRIQLKSEEEILITNLEKESFPKRYIKELYHLRWGIETSFNYLKSAVFVEEFSTRTENGLKQDYFVSLLVYNFVTCLCTSAFKDIKKQKI